MSVQVVVSVLHKGQRQTSLQATEATTHTRLDSPSLYSNGNNFVWFMCIQFTKRQALGRGTGKSVTWAWPKRGHESGHSGGGGGGHWDGPRDWQRRDIGFDEGMAQGWA